MQVFQKSCFKIVTLLLANAMLVPALPMFQLHVPAMMTPEVLSRSTRSTRSTDQQENLGLFTDASPVFKFVAERYNKGIVGRDVDVPEVRRMDDFFRMQYLNSYLGYNMVNSRFSQLTMP